MLKDIDLSNAFKKSETGKYKYNSNLDINETIEIEMELKEDVIKELRIERIKNGKKEEIPLKFLVPSIIKDNQVIVIKGEGNIRRNERGNLNIKVRKEAKDNV